VTFAFEVFSTARFAPAAAARIALELPGEGAVVLTGGTTAAAIYPELATTSAGWGQLDVFFSDERCVAPDDAASNFRTATGSLLERVGATRVHRMAGELDPQEAASAYEEEVRPVVDRNFDVVLLGMGADCHVAALFPGSAAVGETQRLCLPVKRPDGLEGLTLTPPALLASRTVLLAVAGEAKADAVARVADGELPPEVCPASVLRGHDNVTFLLDEAAAAGLGA
jgi:6-phosphogluconolactonase